jgi:Fe-S cluster biogenesis protein NfuA
MMIVDADTNTPESAERDELAGVVMAVIETQIRPLLAIHGGGIELVEITPAGEVKLAFEGACCGCALKSVTYALGVRQKLMPIPGVTDVTVDGVRVSRFALERAARLYGRYTPWVG